MVAVAEGQGAGKDVDSAARAALATCATRHSVVAGGLRWQVQQLGPPLGQAPVALLLHGTGSSSQSWAGLAPLLAPTHTLIVPDLPGHAQTQRPAPAGLSLPGMAQLLGALLKALGASPALLVGHSAGAAIGARMCLDGHCAPHTLFSLNGAWFPPAGAGGWWYAPAARLLALNPLSPQLFSFAASRPAVLRRLLDSTGSRLDAAGKAHYARLAADPAHVGAVLAMMAAWDLQPLLQDLPRLQPTLQPRLHQIVGARDATVPPHLAAAVQRRVAGSRLHTLPGLGHLAHEEDPAAVARTLLEFSRPATDSPD